MGDFAPQDAAFHDVGFFHGADFVAAAAGEFKSGAGDTLDLAFGVALRVDADAFVAFLEDAARFAEIDAGGEFAHDHDVEARDHVFFQRGEIGQRVKALCRAQVGEEVHFLAQAEQAAFWFHGEVEVVVFWAANGAQQHGVDFEGAGHRVIMQRGAVFVIGRAADQIMLYVEGQIALFAEPVDDARDLRHDLGADAVAGEDEQGWVGHGKLLKIRLEIG